MVRWENSRRHVEFFALNEISFDVGQVEKGRHFHVLWGVENIIKCSFEIMPIICEGRVHFVEVARPFHNLTRVLIVIWKWIEILIWLIQEAV